MKFDIISDDDIKIYFYNKIDENEDIRVLVRSVINQYKDLLKLQGYYKVYVYFRKVGLFLELVKIDDGLYKDSLDFKLILDDSNDVYFKSKKYFAVKNMSIIRFFDGYFYGLVDDCFDNILDKVEFGEFIFGYNTNKLLENSIII